MLEVFRLAGVVPNRLALYRKEQLRGRYEARGHTELVRLRAGLLAAHGGQPGTEPV